LEGELTDATLDGKHSDAAPQGTVGQLRRYGTRQALSATVETQFGRGERRELDGGGWRIALVAHGPAVAELGKGGDPDFGSQAEGRGLIGPQPGGAEVDHRPWIATVERDRRRPPPTSGRASNTTTSTPAWCSTIAAVRPESPPPMTTMSVVFMAEPGLRPSGS
jgi:hypothetical protein